jgi:outer membrane protein OmpA-like peptidoglycan-associated protein
MNTRILTYPFVYLFWALALLIASLLSSCGVQYQVQGARANIFLPQTAAQEAGREDTVPANGTRPSVIDMKDRHGNITTYVQTEKDTAGNRQLSVQLREVTVTAKMKSVPERLGMVDVDFIVSVPEELINSKWQLNLTPRLNGQDGIRELESLVISGHEFDKLRQKGYAKYNRYLSRIVPDSLFDARFLKTGAWRRYIAEHNRSELRRVRKDSLDWLNFMGYKQKLGRRYDHFNRKMHRNRQWIGWPDKGFKRLISGLPMFNMERDFVRKYTRGEYLEGKYADGFESDYRQVTASDSVFLKKMFMDNGRIAKNQRLRDDKHIAFAQMVKFPRNDNARLDTVIYNKGKFEYYYSQQVQASESGRRMQVYLDGYVVTTSDYSFLLPRSDTLEYAVSSMVEFLDATPRYMRKVVERKAISSLKANITFGTGKYDVDTALGGNRGELDKVRDMLDKLTGTGEFVLDSISLSAGCSPEGSFSSNMLLSKRRAESIGKYLKGELAGIGSAASALKPYSKGEDWDGLYVLVRDSQGIANKQAILDIIASGAHPDKKEAALRQGYPAEYRYIEKLYPQLRAVEFTFHMHRRGMVKDTIHTTQPDTVYARGMELMKKRKYAEALPKLHEHNDYNTAICLMSLGYDQAAYNILVNEPETSNGEYMLAILASRLGKTQEAAGRYRRSVELDPTKQWRGRLDPEIYRLIKIED